ncbi:hypothetical protein NHQ30_003500 [Ciborinia camelliae]|nr:hypothetical protein NHQ30_003500 [Ciborinia camelliae]
MNTKPASGIVTKVMAIISQEAGLDTVALDPDNEFADFGIDSLLSLTISGRIQEELGLEIQSTMFAQYSTVRELTNFLNRDSGYASPEPDASGYTSESSASDATSMTSIVSGDDIISVIRSVIAEEIGVDASEITSSTALVELGMDSLLGLTIMGKLGETLDMELPANLLQECDTLKDIENALSIETRQSNDTTPAPITSNHQTNSSDNIHTAMKEATATSVILQGNAKTCSKFLFLFPDGSGSATSYASIPRISRDIAVYGLNCPWMKTPHDMIGWSLEDMTRKYITEMRRRQPHGPYYMGGWSAGGILAYEAAQQLSHCGEKIARLILIDSPNPVGLENPPQRMYDFFERVGIFGSAGHAPPAWLRPHFDAFIASLDRYVVKPFQGPPLETHMIYARDGICKNPSDPRPELREDDPREMLWLLNNRVDFSGSGWRELVGEENLKVEVLDDVNHFSMVEEGPKIGKLASFVKSAMG